MIDIAICIFGVLGILACRIIDNAMWECDYEKALGCEFEQIRKENRWIRNGS